MATAPNFYVGEVVQLKSGGPLLTVVTGFISNPEMTPGANIGGNNSHLVFCIYYNPITGTLDRIALPAIGLMLSPESRPRAPTSPSITS